jgi:titin
MLTTLDHTKPTLLYGDNNIAQEEMLYDLFYYDFRDVFSLEGGFPDWVNNGYPVEITKKENIVLKFYLDKFFYFHNKKREVMDVSPMIIEGRTYLPISYVANPLGAQVNWESVNKKIQVLLNDINLELWIGKPNAMLNGEITPIDPDNSKIVPLIVPPGRTMLPVRFVAESLGCLVSWDANIREITIEYKQ